VLFQVLVNLIKNALHAVEDLGARGKISVSIRREDESFELDVTDNGSGISEQDLRRIFEPFFTTKEVGKGTGLGLPISARIVERCGGSLRVQSELGRGTTFCVSLPTNTAVHAGRQLHGANH
jgi:two-component system NtrC family sensor kinase